MGANPGGLLVVIGTVTYSAGAGWNLLVAESDAKGSGPAPT